MSFAGFDREVDEKLALGSSGWFFVLGAASHAGRIKDIPIQTNQISKPRRIAWEHGIQVFYVLKWLLNT